MVMTFLMSLLNETKLLILLKSIEILTRKFWMLLVRHIAPVFIDANLVTPDYDLYFYEI